MTADRQKEERERFEAWARGANYPLDRTVCRYVDEDTEAVWDAWHARSALAAADAKGWRPIEEAPKDGTWVLLWEQYSENPFVGAWMNGRWIASHEHVDAEGGWDGATVVDAISQELVTHWMLLPFQPAGSEEAM